MGYKLEVDDKFMDSDFLPEVCMFSGKTDGVQPKNMSFTYMPPSAQAGMLIGGALLASMMSKRFKMGLPTAPKERFRWGVRRNIWILPVILLPVLGCLCALPFDTHGDVAPAAGGIGFLVGLLVAIGGSIYAWMTNVSFKPIEDGVIRISFPDRMKATYDIYRQALQDYENDRKSRRRSGRGSNDDDADVEDGGWARK